jgi:hypothetical protein
MQTTYYYEDGCLAEEHNGWYTIYVLYRVHKVMKTKCTWERKVTYISGRTKEEAEQKLIRMINEKGWLPLPEKLEYKQHNSKD